MKKDQGEWKQPLKSFILISALATTLAAILAMGAFRIQIIVGMPNVEVLSANLESVTIHPNSQKLAIKELLARPRIERDRDGILSYLSLYLPRHAELNEDRSIYWERSFSWIPSNFQLSPAGLVKTPDNQYILLLNLRQTIQKELDHWGDDLEQGILIEAPYVDQQDVLAWLYRPVCKILFDISCYIPSLAGAIAFFSVAPGLVVFIGLTIGYSAGLKKRQRKAPHNRAEQPTSGS